MDIITSDNRRAIDVGSSCLLESLAATARIRLSYMEDSISQALSFIETGECNWENAECTARQVNLMRDGLASVPPQEALQSLSSSDSPEWITNISPVITSCANLYTTADGEDLLSEIVSILVYASMAKTDVAFA